MTFRMILTRRAISGTPRSGQSASAAHLDRARTDRREEAEERACRLRQCGAIQVDLRAEPPDEMAFPLLAGQRQYVAHVLFNGLAPLSMRRSRRGKAGLTSFPGTTTFQYVKAAARLGSRWRSSSVRSRRFRVTDGSARIVGELQIRTLANENGAPLPDGPIECDRGNCGERRRKGPERPRSLNCTSTSTGSVVGPLRRIMRRGRWIGHFNRLDLRLLRIFGGIRPDLGEGR